DAILLASETDRWNTTYWIADERPYTTLEIYETIAELLDVNIDPIYLPSFISSGCRLLDRILQKMRLYSSYIHVAGEMALNIACDISKARRELGYSPRFSLREGMKESIKWCRRKELI
ncbi:MAG: NAD-dependent epimerase/dehydratase family protein, partial [Candidatus Thorarchaeota archaeon]